MGSPSHEAREARSGNSCTGIPMGHAHSPPEFFPRPVPLAHSPPRVKPTCCIHCNLVTRRRYGVLVTRRIRIL